ncbi:MAG: type IX secretion system protein PorQ [Bacteroidota bacterium]
MNKIILFSILLIGFSYPTFSQIGGSKVYEFLNLPASARITALGGKHITVRDDDLNLAFANPALLNDSMHQQIVFNHSFHIADIGQGYAGFGNHSQKLNTTFLFGLQYINYGDFSETDEFGNINGNFRAAEYALTVGAARSIYERLDVGANVKIISSQLESYNSFGITTDLSAVYHIDEKGFVASMVLRNIGGQLATYRPDNREDVPFELLIGVSKRLKYLPFRFSVTTHHLERWNLLYDNPNSEENTFFLGQENVTSNEWIDNFFRHFIFSGEFLFGKKENFRLRFAYNHFRKQELSVSGLRSLAGFSGGIGMKIKRFRFAYGLGVFHLGGSTSHFSISTSLSKFGKRKRVATGN